MANYKILHMYFSWIFKQGQQNKETCTEINTHPVTGSDVHLCIFNKYHERKATSKFEALRRIKNMPELSGKYNSEN